MSKSRDDKKDDTKNQQLGDLKAPGLTPQIGDHKWKEIIKAENAKPGSGFTLFKGYIGQDNLDRLNKDGKTAENFYDEQLKLHRR